jgi:hypothetical protein
MQYIEPARERSAPHPTREQGMITARCKRWHPCKSFVAESVSGDTSYESRLQLDKLNELAMKMLAERTKKNAPRVRTFVHTACKKKNQQQQKLTISSFPLRRSSGTSGYSFITASADRPLSSSLDGLAPSVMSSLITSAPHCH